MKIIESLNNKLTQDGATISPFYFKEGSSHNIELISNTFAGAAYPMFISFDLNTKSINRAIDLLHERLDYARSVDPDDDFYGIFEADTVKLLSELE